ncbi:flagellar basal body L-ring protein [Halothiobacillus diazotrophicus]|uniref:Flagellar L-ring protein n=1 Tax=Halothiobacillus diazotrophicus TaxID=1860122 RepID=A0A191ZJR4_9GAMM|nr:flagellar basal body L-ring protein FlgH [Halothiobacillus diazotrophicus]ANJ68110.1 flagellar basal body L-ring protein [Halothiobacillus diazotrophicus]
MKNSGFVWVLGPVMLGGVTLGLGGCASQPPVKPDPSFSVVMPPEESQNNPMQTSGAIYQPGQMDNMFVDARPYRVGDILTVVLQESMNGSKSATTATNKSQATAITPPAVFGLTSSAIARLTGNLSSSNAFKGDGTSAQTNNLSGQITVTVARVYANGSLFIQGQKYIGINQGTEYVKLSGLVRPQDIAPDNTVISTRIADAHIAYGGSGAVNDANNMGWLARFFNSPIFPF